MNSKQITELINRRRRQILVHSCIYYVFDESVISDATWTKWATELEELQKTHPDIAKNCVYASAFDEFDHSTGFDLPLRDPWVIGRAEQILERRKRNAN